MFSFEKKILFWKKSIFFGLFRKLVPILVPTVGTNTNIVLNSELPHRKNSVLVWEMEARLSGVLDLELRRSIICLSVNILLGFGLENTEAEALFDNALLLVVESELSSFGRFLFLDLVIISTLGGWLVDLVAAMMSENEKEMSERGIWCLEKEDISDFAVRFWVDLFGK